MNDKSELSWEEVKRLVNEISKNVNKVYLSDSQTKILRAAYDGIRYSRIEKSLDTDAEQINAENDNFYTEDHCKKVGKGIWDMLTQELGENVSKKNFVQPLGRYKERQDNEKKASLPEAMPTLTKENKNIETLEVQRAPIDPYFYIERRNVESLCYETIKQPGSLTRLTSAQGMGKTWLLGKSYEYAEQQGYKTVKLDLNLADKNTLTDSNTFLYWFCVQVSNDLSDIFPSLELQSKIKECWQNRTTGKENCNRYIKYLLSNSECPIVIGIDNCGLLIEFYDTYEEFFSLLRSWHDSSKQSDRVGNIWKKLRVILVCSTQAYPNLPNNYSPFNVGVSIKLLDFNLSEVTTFAKHYELDQQLGENGLRRLMGLVGGHPELINQALSSLKHQQTTLEKFLTLSSTEEGIYSNRLRKLLSILQKNPQLKSAYREVLMAKEPVRLDPEVGFKLDSLGLVKYSSHDCSSRYDLYRQYFSVHLE